MKKRHNKIYVVSYDSKGGFYYCHQKAYPYIPVFGSIGDKKKATKVCQMMNNSI